MPRTPAHLLIAGLAGVALLAGCTAPAAEPEAPPVAESPAAPESAPEPDAGVELPSTYPVDAVPIVAGTLVSADDAGILWNVVVRPDADVLDAADDAEATLTGLGFEVTARVDDNRVYRSDDFDVNINVHDDGTLSYTVRPR